MHEYGLMLGRFQPFHDGHGWIVANTWNKCKKLIIAIGSSQESRTKRNPFTWQERKAIIGSCMHFTRDVTIIEIPDRETKMDDASWGEYIMEMVEKKAGVRPTIIFEGVEEERSHWYDTLDVVVEKLDRQEKPISATEIRQALINDDREFFTNNMPSGTWGFYEDMREIILEVYENE